MAKPVKPQVDEWEDVTSNEWEDIPTTRSGSDALGGFETAARGLLEGATAGISEPVLSGVNAGVGTAIDLGFNGIPGSLDELKQLIAANYAADVARRKRLVADNPLSNAAGNIAGAVLPSPINVGGKIAKGVDKLLSGSSVLKGGGIVKGIARGAASGALGGAGYETVRQTSERPTGFINSDSALEDILGAAGTGAKFGGAVGGVLGIPATYRAARDAVADIGKKVLSVKSGVSVDTINTYLQNAPRIRAAKSADELYVEVSEAVAPMVEALEKGKATHAQAQAVFDNARQMATESLKMQKFDAQNAAKQAEQILGAAVTRARGVAAPRLVGAVEELQSAVSQKSGAAWDKLEKSKQMFPTKVLKAALQKEINGISKTGIGVTESGAGSLASLNTFRDRLDSLPPELSMKQLKAIIQGLDKDIGWVDQAGQFMDKASQQKLAIRRVLDAYLKRHVRGYADAMKPVAEDAALLAEASRIAGTEKQALSTIGSLSGKTGLPNKKVVAKLERRLGKDFIKSTSESGQPEFQQAQAANSRALEMAKPGWLEGAVESATAKQADKVVRSRQAAEEAEAAITPFKRLAPRADGRTGVQSELRMMLGDRSIETRKMFEELSKKTGKDFVQAVDDLRVKEAFEKGDRHGSNNPVSWGLWGALAGALTGGGAGGGIVGAGIGAGIGKYMDKYGPKTAQHILDAVLKVKQFPSPAEVLKWPIPKGARAELAADLAAFLPEHIAAQVGSNLRGVGGAAVRPRPILNTGGVKNIAESDRESDRRPAKNRAIRLKALGE